MKKTIILLTILMMVLIGGCSSRTSEGSCMAACRDSHNCNYYGDDEQLKQESLDCKLSCWEMCYSKIIGKENNSLHTVGLERK